MSGRSGGDGLPGGSGRPGMFGGSGMPGISGSPGGSGGSGMSEEDEGGLGSRTAENGGTMTRGIAKDGEYFYRSITNTGNVG
ncbi:MAG: hypothetical protein ACI4T5_03280 [Prevotella sp.]